MTSPWENMQETYADLDGYGGDYRPEHAFKAGIDTLVDADYDCQILGAALDRARGDLICRISLKLASGATVEWTHWLNKQIGVNAFCADLAVLGFDADRWGPAHNRPLSQEIPKAVARLPGLKFRAHKSSREVPSKIPGAAATTYHDFRVLCRIDGQPMPALVPVQAPAPRLRAVMRNPSQPLPQAVEANSTPQDEDSIPF